MAVVRTDTRLIRASEDVVSVRQVVREFAKAAGFSLVDETKIVTAASELARNVLQYGGGGTVRLEGLNDDVRRGVRLTFEDDGPGIADLELALRDGYSTGGGLGLGLSGARRLANEFQIDSRPGVGTRIVITRWK
jgi:serine/threonine-protein kinase RsbT